MVKRVNNGENAGYTRVTLRNDRNHQERTFLVPVGKKLVTGNKTYNLKDYADSGLVINGHEGQCRFDMIGVTLEHFDVNDDGRIDNADSNWNVGSRINKDKNLPKGYTLMSLDCGEYDANINKGSGHANFCRKGTNDGYYEVRIE